MKCPRCTKNHKRSSGMKCTCGYRFALDPKVDRIGDRRFVAFINAASCNGTYWFTENQLYTAACRRQIRLPVVLLVALIMFPLIFGLIFIDLPLAQKLPPVLLFAAGFGVATWAYVRFVSKLPRAKFDEWLTRYQKEHEIEQLVREGMFKHPPQATVEGDIYDYGVERVLVVQRPKLVDLLVANNVHSANCTAIISSSGYPDYLEPVVKRLITESHSLPIFLLHDATDEGAKWAKQQESHYAGLGHPIVDMGMHPNSMQRIQKIRTLRLEKTGYRAAIDVLPMLMLANGIAMSMEQGVGLEELLVAGVSPDSTASFG